MSGTHVDGKALDDPAFDVFWACCEELKAIVFVHPWDMSQEPRFQAHWFPWLIGMPAETAQAIGAFLFGGIYERFHALKAVFAHGGGSFPGIYGRLLHGFHARPDLTQTRCKVPPSSFLRRIYVDSLTHDTDMLRKAAALFGPRNIVLGSDYPFPLGQSYPPAIDLPHEDSKGLGIAADEFLDGIYYKNFEALLRQ